MSTAFHASCERLYEAVRELHGRVNQALIAELLEETSQTISNWQSRGVSQRGALKAQARLGINATWILTGTGEMLDSARPSTAPTEQESRVDGSAVIEALRRQGVASFEELNRTGTRPGVARGGILHMVAREEAVQADVPGETYVAVRPVRGVRTSAGVLPIMNVLPDGKLQKFATMVPTTGGRYWIEERAGLRKLHDGLPWMLQDMRPAGFLGRAFAAAHPELQLPSNPSQWNDDQVLRVLAMAGEDLPGSLIVGSVSLDRYLARPAAEPVARQAYPRLAEQSLLGGAPGSSAGGEQPKFLCVRRDRTHLLVKFSPPMELATGRRWADLLIAEHLALECLAAADIPAAKSEIYQAGGRTFLEVERFDRTERGRVGMVSLEAYDNEYVGAMDNWAASAERMTRKKLLREDSAHRLKLLEAFGVLIANTDRHYGNVSLLVDPRDGEWTLAPAYDQLPMLYAPVAGEIVPREQSAASLRPTTETLDVWEQAVEMACGYWQSVQTHALISAEFRQIAASHVALVCRLADKGRPSSPDDQVRERNSSHLRRGN